MKKLLLLLLVLQFNFVFTQKQNAILAFNYVDIGEYEKAVTLLEENYKKDKQILIFEKLLLCYQQLEQYDKAFELVDERKKIQKSPTNSIEEGYLHQLQNNITEAEKKYNDALNYIDQNPAYAYTVGNKFEKKSLLEWAMKAYTKGQGLNPNLNFDFQIALLNGQMGNLETMVNKLLDYAYAKPERVTTVQAYFTSFLMNDATEAFSNDLRKNLVLRVQKTPNVFWNQFLSWYYIQQKEYARAFAQEKAVFKRNPESLRDIISLGYLALEDKQNDAATSIFEFVLNNTTDKSTQVIAHYSLMKIKIDDSEPKDYIPLQTEFNALLNNYEKSTLSLNLYLLAAHFNCFYLNNIENAKSTLKSLLDLRLNKRQQAEVKLEYADVLLYDEQFNQAILYYAQVENAMKNDEMAHEASMKMARANYFKNDFEWALKQVKVLKQSASYLIANDALEMFLLINDNTAKDSLQLALTDFSKADFKLYQNKQDDALTGFKSILKNHKDTTIEDITYMRIGQILESKKEYDNAVIQYEKILQEHLESVYRDDALFYLAEIYRQFLNQPQKAKDLYEKIIFNHQDSIYYTEAQKQYRYLRGDSTI